MGCFYSLNSHLGATKKELLLSEKPSFISIRQLPLHELEIYDLRIISLSRSQLKNSCVPTVTLCILRCDLVK